MKLRLVLGRDEEDDRVDRLLVERVEVDARQADADGGHRRPHRGRLGVRDRDAVVEAGRALVLAGDDRLRERVALVGGDPPGGHERVEEFADRVVALGGGEPCDDGLVDDDVSELHGEVGSSWGRVGSLRVSRGGGADAVARGRRSPGVRQSRRRGRRRRPAGQWRCLWSFWRRCSSERTRASLSTARSIAA